MSEEMPGALLDEDVEQISLNSYIRSYFMMIKAVKCQHLSTLIGSNDIYLVALYMVTWFLLGR